MTTAPQAFSFASILAFHYYQQNLGISKAMNALIAKELGPSAYLKFCEIISNTDLHRPKPGADLNKLFKPEYIDNPVEVENEMSDADIVGNYTLSVLFDALSETLV